MYEHLRGGLRNQIPKFNIGSTITQLGNQYITLGAGLQIPFNPQADLLLAIKRDEYRFLNTDNVGNQIPDLSVNLENYIQLDLKRLLLEYEAKLFSNTQASGDGGGSGDEKDSKFKLFLNKGINFAKNYLAQNAGLLANIGMSAVNSWATSGVEQGGLMNGINGASNFIRNIPGVGEKASLLLGTVTTGLNVINKLGGRSIDKYQVDLNLMANMGGSYGGFSDLALRAADATGKTYGLFNGGGYGKAKRLKNEAIRLENIVSDINSTSQDQLAMAGNGLNYTRYQFALNSGFDLNLMRAAKFGFKLERIRRITSKKLEEPVEEFAEDLWEPLLFKEGGSIEDDIFSEDSWEPTISLQGGGQVEKWDFETWFNSIPSEYRAPQYDYLMAFNVLDKEILKNHAKDPNKFHLPSVSGIEDKDGRIPFLKLGKRGENKEVDKEFTEFYEHDRGKDFRSKYDVIYDKDRYYYVPKKFLKGGKTEELLNLAKEYYKDYDLSGINLIEDNSPRTEGNNIYVSNDEDVIHELWHYLSKNKPNEKYKEFYDNLNDERIKSLGGDLDFVKRIGDPSIFYHPSEIESRVKAAKYKSKGVNYTKDFFKALRSENENKYGYNMRDLLHMYNDENLEKIFNLKNGGELSKGESEREETNLKNIIPEGALHKEKHNMENAEDLTKKGIPVIDNDGVQLAEIERDEIVFTLEVTKKLEELYNKYLDASNKEKDELAIEAGKILVYEILYNTEDRTNLISKCKEGGKLNET